MSRNIIPVKAQDLIYEKILKIPIIQPAGDSAALVTLGSQIDHATNRRVHALAHVLEANSAPGLGEAVPGYCTLLLHYDPLVTGYAEVEVVLRNCLLRLEDQPVDSPRRVEIPVHYGGEDGPDLDFVAGHNHLSVEEVILRHSERDYPVYMMGFTPGFPYLGGLDAEIAAPRLATPRSQVPAGSVGIGGEQTGVYPIESPGGWRIIGRTDRVLFDPQRDPPCLLAPGDRVRFVPVDRYLFKEDAHSHGEAQVYPSEVALEVLSPGAMTTVQDQGRYGYERYGVPPAGAMDWLALYAANRLVGNDGHAAGLEFALDAPLLRATGNCLVALAGHGWRLVVGGRVVGTWRAAVARYGEEISIEPEEATGWGYLAVSGGIAVPQLMGSRATYLRGGFGGLHGRVLRGGDVLPVGKFPAKRLRRAGSWLPPSSRPGYAGEVVIPVVPGPQDADFGQAGLQAFFAEEYTITSTSDRMGYRLSGLALAQVEQGELLSQGIAPGSIQVPPDGQPIVLMADRPTAGGYRKIATVARAGLPLLVQAMPGSGRVRFEPVLVDEAQARLRQMVRMAEVGMEEENED